MVPEPASDRSPITCPASLLLSIEALSMQCQCDERRATTFRPAVSCDTLMTAWAASTALCNRLRASTLVHCANELRLQMNSLC